VVVCRLEDEDGTTRVVVLLEADEPTSNEVVIRVEVHGSSGRPGLLMLSNTELSLSRSDSI
jgi:hypothetical protein